LHRASFASANALSEKSFLVNSIFATMVTIPPRADLLPREFNDYRFRSQARGTEQRLSLLPTCYRFPGFSDAKRRDAVEWILELCLYFRTGLVLAAAAASYFDRYTSTPHARRALTREQVQLAAVVCVELAIKVVGVNDRCFMTLDNCVFVCDKQYSMAQVKQMEFDIIEALDCQLIPHTHMQEVTWAREDGLLTNDEQFHEALLFGCLLTLDEETMRRWPAADSARACVEAALASNKIVDHGSSEKEEEPRVCESEEMPPHPSVVLERLMKHAPPLFLKREWKI
jgi:hypothetical protein